MLHGAMRPLLSYSGHLPTQALHLPTQVVALHAAMRALPSYQTTRATGPLVGSVMSEVHVARYATAHATAQRWHLIHAVEG